MEARWHLRQNEVWTTACIGRMFAKPGASQANMIDDRRRCRCQLWWATAIEGYDWNTKSEGVQSPEKKKRWWPRLEYEEWRSPVSWKKKRNTSLSLSHTLVDANGSSYFFVLGCLSSPAAARSCSIVTDITVTWIFYFNKYVLLPPNL
jgi:hypothetical protein